jgi:aspartate kinase
MKNLVAKFGGFSLKDLPALERCVRVVASNPQTKIVVLSAVKGVTDKLVAISSLVKQGEVNEAFKLFDDLQNFHLEYISPLKSPFLRESLNCLFVEGRQILRSFSRYENNNAFEDSVLALGERASSLIFYFVAKRLNSEIKYLDARQVMSTNSDFSRAKPQIDQIRENMVEVTANESNDYLYITQGFIGSNELQQTTTLGRDGSDYSAALFAEAIRAAALQIWTDVPGLASSDPRYVNETRIIHEINYQKAELLSRLGANILHPKTLAPAMRHLIPVFVGSSIEPEKPGTWIRSETSLKVPVAGVAQKKNYIRVFISDSQNLGEKFEESIKFQIEDFVDLHVKSTFINGGVNIYVSNEAETAELLTRLQTVGNMEVTEGFENLSIIGDEIEMNQQILKVVENVRATNELDLFDTGPEHLSFLVAAKNGLNLMNILHQQLFLQYAGQ